MSEERKKPGAAVCSAALFSIALMLYPLSYGPAAWLVGNRLVGEDRIQFAYRPVVWALARLPYPMKRVFFRYSQGLWHGAGTEILLRAVQRSGERGGQPSE